jgi:hypothetical protein
MNSSSSVYVLSCISRWVAYSIFRWSLSAITPKRQRRHHFRLRTIAEAHCPCDRHESSHSIHKVEAASPNFQPRCFLLVSPHSVNLAFVPTG